MRFMDAFIDELNKLAATNVAGEVAPQYEHTTKTKTVVPEAASEDGKRGFMKVKQPPKPDFKLRARTGNMIGGGKMSLK